MKVTISWDRDTQCAFISIPEPVLKELKWKAGDIVSLDIPTGGGLRIFKESDPITLMGGVKEVINAHFCSCGLICNCGDADKCDRHVSCEACFDEGQVG